ncbi:O-antigen ligase family protein [Candidatus Electronema sp. JM]|uniref:O-antigen ligase family protein n=1 Tax=Candidatus Electronema sp. JM TaxID=3401571 RepID=UPI003AA8963E
MSFPLLLCLILFGCQREWLPVQLLLLILQGVCLILTCSRGGWAGAAAAILFILIWLLAKHRSRRWRIIFFSSVLAAVISVLLLASPLIVRRLHEAELASRMLAWRGTVDMILAHWLTGSGPGTYPFVFAQFQPPGLGDVRFNRAHNDYLQFTAELGVGLPLLIIWMMAVLYRHGLWKLDVSSSRLINAATLGSLAGITAMAVHSFADFNFHIPANALLFSALAAIAISDSAVG